MEIVFDEDDKEKENVVYMITLKIAPYRKKYVYIGMTQRALKERIREHLYDKRSQVCKFIQTHEVKELEVEVLHECQFEQLLESAESYKIGTYFLKNGTLNNQKNRLINKHFKGFQKMTLATIKKCCDTLALSLV